MKRQHDLMNFESLVGRINQVQDVLQAQAAHAVNLSLTARNWLVGYYIVEYEQHGEDRAKYGDNLINRLAKEINRKALSLVAYDYTAASILYIHSWVLKLEITFITTD